MVIGILKEKTPETRVSLTPDIVQQFKKLGFDILVEHDAGLLSAYSNEAYEQAGAQLATAQDICSKSDLVLAINHDSLPNELPNKIVLGVYQPLFNPQLMNDWAKQGRTTFSMDNIPRSTRAQSMDVLSSQANIAGYKAVLLAAYHYPRYFPMFMTAAGSIAPAKVLILGAGVAGLQAIATARRLGAVVEVFDTRPSVKEEVQSLGAKFVEVEGAADASKAGGYAVEQSQEFVDKQRARIHEAAKKSDVIITTAQIPGKKAPILITDAMIRDMRPGSIIIDLAAATGGNTDHTENNITKSIYGVTIIGNSHLAATAPSDASKLYAKNIFNFLKLMITDDGNLNVNVDDDIVKGTMITHQGMITHERIAQLIS